MNYVNQLKKNFIYFQERQPLLLSNEKEAFAARPDIRNSPENLIIEGGNESLAGSDGKIRPINLINFLLISLYRAPRCQQLPINLRPDKRSKHPAPDVER
jgi:hypothetical protein